MWLAEQGKRALDEAENPQLLTERQAELYKAKGYSDEWIKERMRASEANTILYFFLIARIADIIDYMWRVNEFNSDEYSNRVLANMT
jgi:hypothetical protein